MKFIKNVFCCLLFASAAVTTANAQLYKIDLTQKINKASLIVEGKVTDQHSFWNDAHTVIYTSNKVHVYKLFKGKIISAEIEIITQGGTVGNKCLQVSEVLQLHKNETGMFFLHENALNIHSPITKSILYDAYSSEQGFLRYSNDRKHAFAPFVKYDNIEQTLYNLIKQQTGTSEKIIDNSIDNRNSNSIEGGVVSNGTTAVAITSFSPATVHAGALNDAANNVLTINGSGFGSTPSGSAAVNFKDANSNSTTPDFEVAYNSSYIISWADNKIVLNVPDRAATGSISVVVSDGTTATSSSELQVFFAVLDAEFDPTVGKRVVKEPRLMNANGSGGYTIQYSTSTAGGGKDFTASPAKQTFERALTTWKEVLGANLIIGSPTSTQKVDDDGINLVVFDNNNTSVPKMADGVLESTYSWFSACTQGNSILTAQKTGFDIIIRNEPVSTGGKVTFEDGPCFSAVGTYDLEMIILHELGHALNLAHINDDYEDGGNGYTTVNPSKLMHYAILDYVNRRSPDASAYQGALYTTTPQNNTYGSCGLFSKEMTPLPSLAISNDECPSTFPSTEITNNTIVAIDLVHATSNKFGDPSFKQVNCKNSGTFVTNNAYYAFLTGAETTIALDIKNYTTAPETLTSCSGQGVRLALYDVQNCPQGQNYPQPITCSNFSSNGTLTISGLQQSHKYLLYFDGLRNTKASFNVVFNSDSSSSNTGNTPIVKTGPNPIDGTQILNIVLSNAAPGTTYQYSLYDAVGRRIATGTMVAGVAVSKIEMKSVAAGVYFLRIVDKDGKKVSTTKILKP